MRNLALAGDPLQVAMTQIDRSFGRQAFGADAANYDRARPAYPDWVFEQLADVCGLGPGSAVLEIGPGTGTATRRLLTAGARVIAIEPDIRLADFLRRWFDVHPLEPMPPSGDGEVMQFECWVCGVRWLVQIHHEPGTIYLCPYCDHHAVVEK